MSSFDLALSSPMYVASLPPFSSQHEPPLEHVLRGLAIIADDNLTQDEMLLKIKKLSSPPHDQSPPGNAAAEPSRSLSPPPVKKHRRQPAAPTPVVEGPSRNLRCSTCKPTQPPGCFALAGSSKVVEEVKCGWSTFRQSLSNLLLLYTLCDEEDHIPWRRGAIVGQGCPGERSFSVSFSGFLFREGNGCTLRELAVCFGTPVSIVTQNYHVSEWNDPIRQQLSRKNCAFTKNKVQHTERSHKYSLDLNRTTHSIPGVRPSSSEHHEGKATNEQPASSVQSDLHIHAKDQLLSRPGHMKIEDTVKWIRHSIYNDSELTVHIGKGVTISKLCGVNNEGFIKAIMVEPAMMLPVAVNIICTSSKRRPNSFNNSLASVQVTYATMSVQCFEVVANLQQSPMGKFWQLLWGLTGMMACVVERGLRRRDRGGHRTAPFAVF
ncbi:hypothetical protein C8R45DRAFT_948263 [Mycena sanguinolenta]|nr:hypothetical protein C8R45DRAFT_948263 [Mycena sanguinolenta]